MSKSKLMMILFVASEALFFIGLIIAYVSYYNKVSPGPASAQVLDAKRTGIFTLALLASSFTLYRAKKGLIRKDIRSLKIWLGATIVLGITFLIGQATEYMDLLKHDVTISRNVFGSSFFTLTGFHGLHVLLGLIVLSVLFGLSWAGDFEGPESPAIESAEIYWHFVDAVWIVVFSVVYLIPHIA